MEPITDPAPAAARAARPATDSAADSAPAAAHPPSNARAAFLLAATGLLLSLAFLLLAAAHLDRGAVADALSRAQVFPWLPLAVLSYIAGHVVRGVRCRRLVSLEASLALPTATNIVVVGYAANNLLPARLGEFARAGMLAERTRMPYVQALVVTFLERVLDGLAIVAWLVAAAAAEPAIRGAARDSLRVAPLLFGVAAAFVLFAVVSPHALSALASRATGGLGARAHDRALRFVHHMSNGVAYLRAPRRAAEVLGLSLGVWLLETGLFFFVLISLGLDLRPAQALFAMAATNLGLLAPLRPGFAGVFPGLAASAVLDLGAGADPAATFGVLVHAAFWIPITVWGAVVVAWYGVQLGATAALARRARSLDPLPLGSRATALDGSPASLHRGPLATALLPVHEIASLPRAPAAVAAGAAGDAAPSRFLVALTEALLPPGLHESSGDGIGLEPRDHDRLARSVAEFTNGQLESLPFFTGLLLATGLCGFRAAVWLRHLRGFASLPLERRRAIAAAWAYGRVALARQLLRAIRSTALLAYFDDPAVAAALDRAGSRRAPHDDAGDAGRAARDAAAAAAAAVTEARRA